MKYSLAFIGFLALACLSCESSNMVSMEKVLEYQDSAAKLVPGAATIQARIDRNFNTESITLKLIVGAPGFYDSSPDKKDAVAIKAGEMALRILGPGVDRGVLIITKVPMEYKKDDPADGRVSDMKLDILKRGTQVAE